MESTYSGLQVSNCSSIIYYSELPWSTRQILQFSSKWSTGTTMNSPEMQIFELQFHYILNNYYLWKQILQSSSKNHYQYLSGEYSDQVLSLSWWRVLILQWDNIEIHISDCSLVMYLSNYYLQTQVLQFSSNHWQYLNVSWLRAQMQISDCSLIIYLSNHYLQTQILQLNSNHCQYLNREYLDKVLSIS